MADRKIIDQNVFFLSGFQNTLNQKVAAGEIQVGAFYLTEDTNRLYIGKEAGKLDLLNSAVRFVTQESFSTLGTSWKNEADKGATHLNELVYITDLNILAVWAATGKTNPPYDWVQINPDTHTEIKGIATEISGGSSADSNEVTVQSTVSFKDGNTEAEDSVVDTFKIVGNGKTVKVKSTDADTISITGDTYTLSSAADGSNKAKVSLSSALGQAGSEFTITAGDNVKVTASGSDIKIDSEKWIPDGSSVEVADGKIKLTLQNKDGEGPGVIQSNELFVYVGNNTKKLIGEDLNVYTKDQVEAKLRGLNGMTYKGTVGPANTAIISSYKISNNAVVNNDGAAIDVSAGDMFLVVCENDAKGNPIPITFNGNSLITGDLIIAVGTEGADGFIGSDLAWNVVPSGNDTIIDTTYAFEANAADHKISLKSNKDGDVGEIGAIDLDAGNDDIVLSSSTESNNRVLKTSISHKVYSNSLTPVNSNETLSNGQANITVMDGISISNGHVTGITTKTLTLPSYSINVEGTDSGTEAKSSVSLSNQFKAGSDVLNTLNTTFESETLDITLKSSAGQAPVVGFELTWGTF